MSRRIRIDAIYLLVLIALTVAAFWPSVRCGFILDDDRVIANQPHVNTGITAGNIRWSLTAFELGYPIPVTLWSFMLDADLFGVRPAAFHAENLLWHTLDVALLYLLLRRLTGCPWRSALVAALFGIHPLRVESVAWITERKDVLAAYFGILSIHLYVSYIRKGGTARYLLVVPLYALSLFAKPMLATLPFLLLLIDFWPLGRLADSPGPRGALLRRLLLEKLPLFAIAACATAVGILGPSPRKLPISRLPFAALLANALVSYMRYIGKMFWFRRLSISYPVVPHWPIWQVAAALSLLLFVTAAVLLQARRRPWLAVGWLWYLIVLFPASGVHILGDFSMADRYTYFPMIGLLIMAAWSLPDQIVKLRWRIPAGFAAATLLVGLLVATRAQISTWSDNVTLFQHAINVSGPSMTACGNLAISLARNKCVAEAIPLYKQALAFDPDNPEFLKGMALASDEAGDIPTAVSAYLKLAPQEPNDVMLQFNLGTNLIALGRSEEGIRFLSRAVELSPGSTEFRGNLATALLQAGRFREAVDQCQRALAVDQSATGVRETLADALANLGQFDAAKAQYQIVILNDRKSSVPYSGLGALSLAKGQLDSAITYFRHAIELNPRLAGPHSNLGVALAQQGRPDEAVSEFRKALQIEPNNAQATENLRLITVGK